MFKKKKSIMKLKLNVNEQEQEGINQENTILKVFFQKHVFIQLNHLIMSKP